MTDIYVTRLLERSLEWLLTSGVRIAAVLVAMTLLTSLMARVTKKFRNMLAGAVPTGPQLNRAETLTQIVRDVVRVTIVSVGVMLILAEVGVDLKPLLAAAGIGGLAIGFGAQHLVRDVLSGFFILLENQIRVGDVVEVAGVGGLVEEVRLRTIVLRDEAGSVHTVPNGMIDKVKNMTRGYSFYVFNVAVAYRENVDEVMAVLGELGAGLQGDPQFGVDILEPLEMMGVDRFEDSAVIIKCRIKTKPIKQWRIGREMNRRIKQTFDARDIEIPFPHHTVYWGTPKKGSPPPLLARLVKDEA